MVAVLRRVGVQVQSLAQYWHSADPHRASAFELGLGQRQIARNCGMGLGTVNEYLERAVAAGIGWPLPEGWSEEELEAKLFGNQPERAKAVQQRPQPDWKAIHEQLQQHRHLKLQLVWEEYRQAHPEGHGYSWFCEPPRGHSSCAVLHECSQNSCLYHAQRLHRRRHRIGEEHGVNPLHDVAGNFEKVPLVFQRDQCLACAVIHCNLQRLGQ